LETKAWHALRGYNEKIVNYGPDDWDMLERMLKMMDNSFLRQFSFGKKGKMNKIPPITDPIFLSDVEETKGLITNFHIASNVFATHLYHERLTGPITWYQEERAKPGFIRNRKIEWGMSYDKQ
jgi:predicted glycosyltransferase involved in capsule biosynthesis